MRRDLLFILSLTTLIFFLIFGIFIRGIKTESIAENRKLEMFPHFSLASFLDSQFQHDIEAALTDQILFGEIGKSLYNNLKNKSHELVVIGLQGIDSPQKPKKNSLLPQASEETSPPIDLKTEIHNQDKYQILEEVDKDLYTDNIPIDKTKELPMVIQKELAPKATILVRKPEYSTFEIDLKPRGNNIVEIIDSQHLFYPKRSVSQGLSLMTSKANNYNQTLLNYPDLNFFCYYIESDVDVDFVNGEISHDNAETFFSLLDPNIKASALYINSVEDYQKYFYKTDHHWDVEGQLQGYKDIIALLKGEFEPILDIEILAIDDLKYNGYKSRKSNDYSIKDDFKVLMADLGEYKTYINYEEAPYGRKEDYLAGNYTKATGLNYYRDCNGVDYAIVEFDFMQPDKGNLLCYVDSFSNPINAFIASHYNKTYFVDYRHYQPSFGNSLDFGDFVEEHDINDVLFTGYYFFYVNYMFKVTD